LGVKVWLPDSPARDDLGELPEEVELGLIPRNGPLPDAFESAEFLVPPYGSRRVLKLLPQMRSLRIVQANSAGVEWLLPSVPPGVTVCNARGTRDIPVAEWVLAAILDAVKDLPRLRRQQEERNWEATIPDELASSRALIVGYGSIGRAVENRLSPFGVHVDRVARRSRPGVDSVDRLKELLPLADIVILLMPETQATISLFDRSTLERLKPGALLVNAARGGVVDTDALVDAVAAGRIRAALDVTDPEPLPADHPLWRLPGVLLTPHIAGDSDAAERRVHQLIGEQVRRYLRGEPLLNAVERR
jgi:phosphoglycerate dehydrogenase-like enzyme